MANAAGKQSASHSRLLPKRRENVILLRIKRQRLRPDVENNPSHDLRTTSSAKGRQIGLRCGSWQKLSNAKTPAESFEVLLWTVCKTYGRLIARKLALFEIMPAGNGGQCATAWIASIASVAYCSL